MGIITWRKRRSCSTEFPGCAPQSEGDGDFSCGPGATSGVVSALNPRRPSPFPPPHLPSACRLCPSFRSPFSLPLFSSPPTTTLPPALFCFAMGMVANLLAIVMSASFFNPSFAFSSHFDPGKWIYFCSFGAKKESNDFLVFQLTAILPTFFPLFSRGLLFLF